MNKREKIVIITIFVSSFLVLGLGVYFGQYNLSYRVTSSSYLIYLGNGLYSTTIINLTYADQLAVVSNATPYLIPYSSNISYSSQLSNIIKESINATNHIDDIYTYPSLQGEFLVLIVSHYLPQFSYSITAPTSFSTLSAVFIVIGIALLISGAAFVYLLILRGFE